jgi:hypothetical protein
MLMNASASLIDPLGVPAMTLTDACEVIYQISYQIFIILRMNCLRELPSDYLELCPVIDEKYRVLFKLGFGRFSQYPVGYSG